MMYVIVLNHVQKGGVVKNDWWYNWNLCTNCYYTGFYYHLNSGRPVDVCMGWFCCFCPSAGFWSCNQVFDCDDDVVLLCTWIRLYSCYMNLCTNCHSYRHVDFRVCWVCWFCLGTSFWSCNLAFDCDDDAGLISLFSWMSWMANMIAVKYLSWNLVYFNPDEGLVRTVRFWSISDVYGFDYFDCYPLWFPLYWYAGLVLSSCIVSSVGYCVVCDVWSWGFFECVICYSNTSISCTLFPCYKFSLRVFIWQGFLMRQGLWVIGYYDDSPLFRIASFDMKIWLSMEDSSSCFLKSDCCNILFQQYGSSYLISSSSLAYYGLFTYGDVWRYLG